MRYVYLDNYRGFQDALISVVDVNFCVGENSSGKTSFLSAVNLLSSHRFWFEQNFEGSETTFKHFDDYVSVSAVNRSYFRMGVAELSEPDQGSAHGEVAGARAYLFTYFENEGMPRLASCTTNLDDCDVTLYFSEQAVRFRVTPRRKPLAVSDFSSGVFNDWAKLQDDRSLGGTKQIKDEAVAKGYMPPLFALTVALRQVTATAKGKPKSMYGFPGSPFGSEAAWIAPIRTKPRRTYDEIRLEFSPEGTHVPYLIKKMLDGGVESQRFSKFIMKFGQESGLFKDVKVHKFGQSASSPFELEVMLESKPLNISNVGYGVSQGLPVVVEAFARPEGSLFAIQQPEVHLHPRAQASIGEMIFLLAANERKRFIVETHSDFTIDRFRTSLRDSKKVISSQVLFFERVKGRNIVKQILIDSCGDLSDEQPKKYREFFLKEGLRVIGI